MVKDPEFFNNECKRDDAEFFSGLEEPSFGIYSLSSHSYGTDEAPMICEIELHTSTNESSSSNESSKDKHSSKCTST